MFVFMFITIFLHTYSTLVRALSSIQGSTVTLVCSIQPTIPVQWIKDGRSLSYGSNINVDLTPNEFRTRLSIIVDNGKFNLNISNLRKTDEGQYQCTALNSGDIYNLTVIVGPTNVSLENKANNKLQGTEGQIMRIRCTAEGGDPRPYVILQIGTHGPEYTGSNGELEHTILPVVRSFDGETVTCRTFYHVEMYQPLTDTAKIYLYLKPLPPTFSPNPISTEDTKQLVLTCTSTGSRPVPTERIWLLGDSNTDITSNSAEVSPIQDPSMTDTYIATSILKYTVHKQYNGKSITCGFKNIVTADFIKSMKQIDVKYAPTITVSNKTLELTQSSIEIQCHVDGNPNTYTYKRWEHRSKNGTHIRYLNAAPNIILAPVSDDIRYQETGVYVCTASNGIVNNQNQLDQKGSGYVVSKAPPFFLNGSQTVLGQTRNDVKIEVSVYSEPKFTGLTWYKDVSPISPSSKYERSISNDIITTSFHGVSVQVDGYKLTLTIKNLQEPDFTNYTVRISNGVGGQVEHLVVLLSASPPDTPTDFNITTVIGTSVTIEWKPAFDGGHNQSFVVQYRVSGEGEWQNASVPNTVGSSQGVLQRFSLTNLFGLTLYEFRMFAVNKFDLSSPTEIVETVTGQHERLISNNSNGAVIGGVSAVIIVILSASFGLVFWRKKHGIPNEAKGETKNNVNEYENVSGKEGQTKISSKEYESIGMQQLPSIYSQLESSNYEQVEDSQLQNRSRTAFEQLDQQKDGNVYDDIDKHKEAYKKESKVYANLVL